MITFDDRLKIVELTCDSPGCIRTHAVSASSLDGGRSGVNSLRLLMIGNGWSIDYNQEDIKHYCSSCTASNPNAVVANQGTKHLTKNSMGGMRVSAQELRSKNSKSEPPSLGAGDKDRIPAIGVGDGELDKIRDLIGRGRKVFGDG